jgi:hypothetical protein
MTHRTRNLDNSCSWPWPIVSKTVCTKRTQIASFSSENQGFLKKRSQIKAKMRTNPDVHPNTSQGIVQNEPIFSLWPSVPLCGKKNKTKPILIYS